MVRSKSRSSIWMIAALACQGCGPTDPPPTPEEIKFHDAWATQVPPQKKADIDAIAAHHTSWTLKKKLVWEGEQYYHVALGLHHGATSQPATQPSVAPVTQP